MGDSAARLEEMRRLGGRLPGLMAAGALGVVVVARAGRGLLMTKPTGNTHACFGRWQDFVPEVSGHEADDGSHAGFDQDEGAGFIPWRCPQLELAAVSGLPVRIEVEDNSNDTLACPCVPVQMWFVKCALRVNGKMAFEIEQSEKKPLIESESQIFEFREINGLFG